VRVAVTLEQCWHDVPGGTAAAAIEVTRQLMSERVALVGVAARHRTLPPAPWTPPIEVRHHALPRPLLYEAWHGLRRPVVERVTGPVDVVHATTIIVPGHLAPLVVTLHDLAWRHEGARFTRRGVRFFERGLELVRQEARLVLCSSRATMADCSAAGIEASRLRYVPLGVGVSARGIGFRELQARYRLPDRFVLFVGTLEPRKNLAGLVAAMAELPDLGLVVVGPAGWGADTPAHLGERARVLGFVGGTELSGLYCAATVFCYPSFWEGFGLPILEAMAHGAPVVTSRGGATEEVAGDAAVLVDPHDPSAIAAGIRAAHERASELAAAGRARAAAFTWEATAASTLAAYREVVER
jgi:glycosyltransferase involved in cell wall biosynthesis